MTTTQIKSFITVSKFQSFTKAANELQLSVSALSRQISAMEEELQIILINRNSRTFELTNCGRYLYSEYQKIYNEFQGASLSAQKIHQGFSGSLSFGIYDDITLYGPLKKSFLEFRQKYPLIHTQLEHGSQEDLIDSLLNKKFDCIIGLFFSLKHYDFLKYKIVEHCEEGILISTDHPLSKKRVFKPFDFRNQTFILIESPANSYMFQGPLEYFREHDISPRIMYVKDPDTAALMVEAGIGVAFSHKNSVGSFNPGLRFIPIPEDSVMTPNPYVIAAWNEEADNTALGLWLDILSGVLSQS